MKYTEGISCRSFSANKYIDKLILVIIATLILNILHQKIMIGLVHTVPCGQKYKISTVHRQAKPTTDKCIWTNSCPEELNCFNKSYTEGWYVGDNAWGVMSIGTDRFQILGVNYLYTDLYFAKFKHNSGEWHGYPADFSRRPHDRPAQPVLNKWHENKIISKALRARIQGGRL